MRFYRLSLLHILLSLAGYGVLGCGSDPEGAGSLGHVCYHAWPNSGCDEGLKCVDDVCTECGKAGMLCCDSDTCNSGLACDDSIDVGTCQGSCGLDGLPCCADGTCPGGGQCNDSGVCAGGSSESCVSGSTPHVVYVIDGTCTAYEVDFLTDTVAEAEVCRQQLVDAAKFDEEVGPLDTPYGSTDVCKDGWGPYTFHHFSQDQLAKCEANWCSNCDWTSAPQGGDCPFGP
jgi:hypothetical protein